MFLIDSLTVEASGKFEGVLDVSNYNIINIDTPINDFDGVNKLYVDTISLSGGAQDLESVLNYGNSAGSNQIDMNFNRITNTDTPILSGDVANKFYVDNNRDVDGGFANAVYLPIQNINGGSA